jgi:ABC-type transport system involved in multi-copper enzyme maturation permease subunit
MTLLPIVERELRVAARRAWVYWLRLTFAGLALGVWVLLLAASGGGWSQAQLGRALLDGISIPALVFALFTGVFLTADCVSSERREGTLGLLFLTDLRGYDIALGKLVAKSLHAASGLLAIVPMLALPILLGGVSGLTVATRALTLLLAAFLSLTSGLLCSTLLGETRKALLATLAMLMVLVGAPLLLGYAWGRSGIQPAMAAAFYHFSLVQLFTATGRTFWLNAAGWQPFVVGCLWQFGLSLGFLAVASWRLPHLARLEKPLVAPAPPPARRRSSAGIHPFWFAGQEPGLGRMLFGFLVLLWSAWLGLSVLALTRQEEDVFGLSLIPAYALHLLLKCQFAAEAARRLAQDRASGALEILLSTPLRPAEILDRSWQALKRRFRPARVLALLTNGGILACFLVGDGLHAPEEDWPIIIGLMLAAGALLFLDCQALAWTAMLEGARGRTPLRAALGAIGRVLVPAWAGIFLYLFLGFSGLLHDEVMFKTLLVLWAMGGVALDLALAQHAAGTLRQHLRRLAAGDQAPPLPPAELSWLKEK